MKSVNSLISKNRLNQLGTIEPRKLYKGRQHCDKSQVKIILPSTI